MKTSNRFSSLLIQLGSVLACALIAPHCHAQIHEDYSHYIQPKADTPTPIDHFRSEHPRLFITDQDLSVIHRKIDTDPFAKSEYDWLRSRSEALLSVPVREQQLYGQDGQFLWQARDIEDRILTLSGMYRLTGDKRFADRAIKEMLNSAAFPTWNPAHFLDVAEMTAALGIGYDWLYPELTSEQRATIRQAILDKGITPFMNRLYRNDVHYRNNWGQVCFGGETIGTLAIAETSDADSMARVQEMVSYARPGIDLLMKLFAPDGGFEEGPVYWNYAVVYNVLYLAALDSALGTNFGESNAPGFDRTPLYRIQSLGPVFQYANFGDASPPAFPAPEMYWFARRFHRPEYAREERQLVQALRGKMSNAAERESVRFCIFGLFWYALSPVPTADQWPPEVASFARIHQAFMRTSWTDPNAWYAGFKGGDAGASHGHLDLGSFVLDGLGQRWGIDLAADSYDLPGYFGKQRFDYYRTRTEGHNTLTIDGQNEDLDAVATMKTAEKEGVNEIIVANLDRVYKSKLQHWTRSVKIEDAKRLLVQDEIAPQGSVDVMWHFHTRADVKIADDGRSAVLTQGGGNVKVRILAPADARFGTANTQPSPPQQPNPGVTDLVIRLAQVSSPETVAVVFEEGSL